MLELVRTTSFKKDQKRYKNSKKVIEILNEVILVLLNKQKLSLKFNNHELIGEYNGCFDCHILPDLVLIYRLTETELILVRLGSHSELF